MDDSKAIDRTSPAPSQIGAGLARPSSDVLLQNRFRRALQEPMPSQAAQSDAELVSMLERVCSAMYVGEKNINSQRIVLMLDHVLAGAAAVIVREGVHLSVRLYARTHAALRLMSSQRASLIAAIGSNDKNVDVTVVYGDPSEHSQ